VENYQRHKRKLDEICNSEAVSSYKQDSHYVTVRNHLRITKRRAH